MDTMNTERICPVCGEHVPAGRGPLAIYCSGRCRKRRYNATHREENRERQRRYNATHREENRERQRLYAAEHYRYLYQAWRDMLRRCLNPQHVDFKRYGARGIMVCARWRNSCEAFEADILALLGPRPAGKSLDRVINDAPYAPWNVRWASRAEQASNRRLRGLLESQLGAVAYYAQFINNTVAPPKYSQVAPALPMAA